MDVTGIDERQFRTERFGSDFLVYIYSGHESSSGSWSVDSYLLSDATLPQVWAWLEDHLPPGCCWSLGVVRGAERTTPDLEVHWIVGDDLLNMPDRTPLEERVVQEMLARRDSTRIL